jgi:hypothetical protein
LPHVAATLHAPGGHGHIWGILAVFDAEDFRLGKATIQNRRALDTRAFGFENTARLDLVRAESEEKQFRKQNAFAFVGDAGNPCLECGKPSGGIAAEHVDQFMLSGHV